MNFWIMLMMGCAVAGIYYPGQYIAMCLRSYRFKVAALVGVASIAAYGLLGAVVWRWVV